MRKEIYYKGHIIKPVYRKLWCVYEPGPEAHNVFGARGGTVFPDIKISKNLKSVEECKELIDRWENRCSKNIN